MNQILEQLYMYLNQEKEVLNKCANAVEELITEKDHGQHIERLIAYNLQKGRTTGVEDVIHEIEKMASVTNRLKVV